MFKEQNFAVYSLVCWIMPDRILFSVNFPPDSRAALRIHPVEGRVLVQSGFFESQTCAARRHSRFGLLDFFGLDLALDKVEVS